MIEELERLAKAATPGPWNLVRHTCALDGTFTESDDWSVKGPTGSVICIEGNHLYGPLVGDPEYIVAANPAAVLKLIEVAKAAQDAYRLLDLSEPNAPQTEVLATALNALWGAA